MAKFIESFIQAMYIVKKDARIYYFKPPVIMFGLIFPVFLYFAFYIGRQIPPSILVPGLVAITSFFGSSSIEAVAFPLERRTGNLDRLLTAPVSLFTIVLGKTLAGCVFGLISSLIFAGIIVPLSGSSLTNPLHFISGVALSSLMFSSLGIPISVYAKEVPEAMMSLNLIRLPMIFVCGVFAPIDTMPASLQALAHLLPLTYSVDALRHATTGPLIIQAFVIDVAAPILYSILFLVIATKMLERTLE